MRNIEMSIENLIPNKKVRSTEILVEKIIHH